MQEVVKILVDRPLVLEALLGDGEDTAPAASTVPSLTGLDAFIDWLWPLTAAPERYCRQAAPCSFCATHKKLLQTHVRLLLLWS